MILLEIQRKYKRKYKVGGVGHFEHLSDCWILCFRGIPCPFVPFCVVVGCFPQPPIASEKVPARSVQKRHFRGVGQFGKCVSGRKTQGYISHRMAIDGHRRDPPKRFSAHRGEMLISLRKMNGFGMRPDPPSPFGNPLSWFLILQLRELRAESSGCPLWCQN